MKKDITICIGTVGYPTFNKCHQIIKNIAKTDYRVNKVVVIKDKYPTSAWLNEMRGSCETTWCLQVDEDMYLYNNAVDDLLDLARKTEDRGLKVLNASGLLYDLFLKTNIGSLKLWNTDAFKVAEFKNVQGADRMFAKDATKFGFSNVEIKKVLGEHDSAPSPEIAYFKYKEYLAKIRRFQGEDAAKKFLKHFRKICNQHNNEISKFAMEGAVAGLHSSLENCTKNYKTNMNSQEIKELK